RDLGFYLTVLVVVTDAAPFTAICVLIRRFAYIVIPFSVMLIKYFPELGLGFSDWTDQKMFMGVAGGKNSLGALALTSGLFFIWDTMRRWENRKEERKFVFINLSLLAASIWLLKNSDSKTSLICFLLGTAILLISSANSIKNSPRRILTLLVVSSLIVIVLDSVFGLRAALFSALDRDETLTGRVDVWKDVQAMVTNPLLGFGYESFWLGDRLTYLWKRHPWQPNQAHNGYLEVYLNLGIVGLTILSAC